MANRTKFSTMKDQTGSAVYAPLPSNQSYSAILAAGVPSSVAIPTGVDMVIFVFGNGGDVWVNYEGTATLPTLSSFVLSTSMLNPSARQIPLGATNISFVCANANYVEVSFYTVYGYTFA